MSVSLALRHEDCVRTRAVSSACRACVDACPTAAVAIGARGAITVERVRCIDCGACAAACPTEAIETSFDVAGFTDASGPATLRCGEAGLPCVAALGVEELLRLALRHGQLEVAAVAGCAAAGAHRAVDARVEQVNELCSAFGSAARVRLQPTRLGAATATATATATAPAGIARATSRRDFLRGFLPRPVEPEAAPAPLPLLALDPATLDVERLRGKRLPPRRGRLLAVLPCGAEATLADDMLGFTSAKQLDVETCTACMRCVAVCPTGALTTSALRDELRFDAAQCVRCGACHDACEPGALRRGRRFELADLAGGARLLGRLAVAACGECGALFTPRQGEVLCPRCADLDDEARELAGGR